MLQNARDQMYKTKGKQRSIHFHKSMECLSFARTQGHTINKGKQGWDRYIVMRAATTYSRYDTSGSCPSSQLGRKSEEHAHKHKNQRWLWFGSVERIKSIVWSGVVGFIDIKQTAIGWGGQSVRLERAGHCLVLTWVVNSFLLWDHQRSMF